MRPKGEPSAWMRRMLGNWVEPLLALTVMIFFVVALCGVCHASYGMYNGRHQQWLAKATSGPEGFVEASNGHAVVAAVYPLADGKYAVVVRNYNWITATVVLSWDGKGWLPAANDNVSISVENGELKLEPRR